MPGNTGGNRQDNRNRGNAAQLLEKYKALARDSQLAGDRVQTEYYLQFADHYFRVLSESRSRFEEQRRARGEDYDDEDIDEDGLDSDGEESAEPQVRADRGDRGDRGNRDDRQDRRRDRGDRVERSDRREEDGERRERVSRDDRGERRERAPREDRGERRERGGRLNGRSREDEDRGEAPAQIAFDTLPPAIGIAPEPETAAIPDGTEVEEAPRPRRRVTRRPKVAEGDGEIAPAA